MITTGIQSQNEACLLTLKCKNTNDETWTILHELGHSFGLSHTFEDEVGLIFSQGYTDSIMDYEHTKNGDGNLHKGTQWSLFKHHWDIMNNDNNLEWK